MIAPVFYSPVRTDALQFAEQALKKEGLHFTSAPDDTVTHLLLGVPSFAPDGSLKGGGRLEELLPLLPPQVTVCGGLLDQPALQAYKTIDMLADPGYVAENARITAHCAVRLAMNQLPMTLYHCPVLVIGWGRIGKCLAQLLRNIGVSVTVAARKEVDRAMISALGYDTLDTGALSSHLSKFRVIFNTAPVMLLPKEAMQACSENCLKIDLASKLGMEDSDVIWARGLPGKDAPETSGALIAQTLLRLL